METINKPYSFNNNLLNNDSCAYRYTHCIICGRPLKTNKSQLRGYGDVCYLKINQNFSKNFKKPLDK